MVRQYGLLVQLVSSQMFNYLIILPSTEKPSHHECIIFRPAQMRTHGYQNVKMPIDEIDILQEMFLR